MALDYGEVLDGREGEFVTSRPGKVKPGDLHVSFDGWFVRGHAVTSVEKIGNGNYLIRLASSRTGRAHAMQIHANTNLKIIPQPTTKEDTP